MKRFYFLSIVLFISFLHLYPQKNLVIIDYETGAYNQGKNPKPTPCSGHFDTCDCAVGVSLKIVKKEQEHPVRAGAYSSYHRLANCHEKAEFVEGSRLGFDKEIWIGWSIFLPDTPAFRYNDFNYTIISQFHDNMGCSGNCGEKKKLPPPCSDYKRGGPTVFVINKDGEFSLSMRHVVNNCVTKSSFLLGNVNDMLGRWTDIVVNAKFVDNETGFLKIWVYEAGQNPGHPKLTYKGSTYYMKTDGTHNGGPAFRTGFYRGNPGHVPISSIIMYTDEIRYGYAEDGIDFENVAPR